MYEVQGVRQHYHRNTVRPYVATLARKALHEYLQSPTDTSRMKDTAKTLHVLSTLIEIEKRTQAHK